MQITEMHYFYNLFHWSIDHLPARRSQFTSQSAEKELIHERLGETLFTPFGIMHRSRWVYGD
jgi:hypothetical protein